MNPELIIIAALDDSGAIGLNGDMPWGRAIRGDLKYFRYHTMGCPVIMGRKTYESLPAAGLPGRSLIVLSRDEALTLPNAQVVHTPEAALKLVEGKQTAFVIGGAEVYRLMLPWANKLYLTRIHHVWENADTYFPPLSNKEWVCMQSEIHPIDEENSYPYSFSIWERL